MGEQKKTEPLIFQRDSANKIFFIFFSCYSERILETLIIVSFGRSNPDGRKYQ